MKVIEWKGGGGGGKLGSYDLIFHDRTRTNNNHPIYNSSHPFFDSSTQIAYPLDHNVENQYTHYLILQFITTTTL